MSNQHPHEKLLKECQKLVGNSAWAIGIEMDDKEELSWIVYVSNKKAVRKIPKKFEGRKVAAVHCQRPKLA